jgi:hypothetical protein
LWVVTLIVALLAGVGLASASTKTHAASLKISVPATMKRGSVLKVTASGYSGKYNAVSWGARYQPGSCEGPVSGTIGTQAVHKGHTFSVDFTNIQGAPGTLMVCVYLYSSAPNANDAKGHYLVKSARVKVS